MPRTLGGTKQASNEGHFKEKEILNTQHKLCDK